MTPVEYERYLTAMDEETFTVYLAEEEKKYVEMKERAAEQAMLRAKEYKELIRSNGGVE